MCVVKLTGGGPIAPGTTTAFAGDSGGVAKCIYKEVGREWSELDLAAAGEGDDGNGNTG